MHFPGHTDDYLILDTPLRGDFEVTCELKLQNWEEMYVRYGSHQFDLQHDRKHYKMQMTVSGGGRESLILPPLSAAKDNSYQFRLSVKDGWLRAIVDGRELAAQRIGPNPDPWLMLACS